MEEAAESHNNVQGVELSTRERASPSSLLLPRQSLYGPLFIPKTKVINKPNASLEENLYGYFNWIQKWTKLILKCAWKHKRAGQANVRTELSALVYQILRFILKLQDTGDVDGTKGQILQ